MYKCTFTYKHILVNPVVIHLHKMTRALGYFAKLGAKLVSTNPFRITMLLENEAQIKKGQHSK